jgi:hypothetical protein
MIIRDQKLTRRGRQDAWFRVWGRRSGVNLSLWCGSARHGADDAQEQEPQHDVLPEWFVPKQRLACATAGSRGPPYGAAAEAVVRAVAQRRP